MESSKSNLLMYYNALIVTTNVNFALQLRLFDLR